MTTSEIQSMGTTSEGRMMSQLRTTENRGNGIINILFTDIISSKNIMTQLNATNSSLHWIAWGCLILLAVGLRLLAFQGYSDSDPRAYSILADDLAHGIFRVSSYDGPTVFPFRVGLYAPTSLLISLFGLSEQTLASYPFVVSLAGCLLAYTFARSLYCPIAGLIGMAMLAALPFDVLNASLLLPDGIAAFWANLGLLLIYFGIRKNQWGNYSMVPIIAGVCLGLSWLCKESVVYLTPFVVILCLQHEDLKAKVASLIWVGIGAFAVLGIEMLSYQIITGDPLLRFHAIERNYVQNAVWFFDKSSPYFGWADGGYANALLKRLVVNGPLSILQYFTALPAFAGLAIIGGIVFGSRRLIVPGMWFVSLFLIFNFMSSSLQSYRPLPLFERYLYLLILPSVVLVSGFLAENLVTEREVSTQKMRLISASILLSAFCVFSAYGLSDVLRSRSEPLARGVASKLTKNDIVYTDYRTATSLVFFRTGTLLPFTATTIPYENLKPDEMKAGAYVLVDRNMSRFLSNSYQYKPPLFTDAPPITWRTVGVGRGVTVFQIEGVLHESR